MNIIIPMLGQGSKFIQAGITTPKPLIKIHNTYMFEWALKAVEFLNIERDATFLIRKEHAEDWQLDQKIRQLVGPKAHVKVVDFMPQGAAKTVLLERDHIDSDEELIIYNYDQYFKSGLKTFFKESRNKYDGIIPIFHATHPRWSFVDTDNSNLVKHVSEKEVISNKATVGFYYFRKGSDFVRAADVMMKKNIMVANEYYVCPVYNELISEGKKIYAYMTDEMWSLGTPEDVDRFTKFYKDDLIEQ
ncbi:MAG: Beta-phosphoglucomutase [Candidatus Parcubacteria bacterium]|jgi:dTDP-glucose pyrophosphorylase